MFGDLRSVAGENGASSKLALSLTPAAAEKMKAFSDRHLMKKSVLILNGEAVSSQLIRAVMAEGKLEITGGDSTANTRLYTLLQNKLSNSKR